MASVARFVGLDYHQDQVQVCVLDRKGAVLSNTSVPNTWQAMVAAVGQTKRSGRPLQVQATLESCSGAAHLADELIAQAGWQVKLAHPGITKRMKHNPDKSDLADAYVLADLIRLSYLPRVWLAPEEIRQLRSLVRYRQQRVQEQTKTKLRIRGLLREHRLRPPRAVRAWTVRWWLWLAGLKLDDITRYLLNEHCRELESLKLKIREIELRLQQLTAADPLVARLLSLPGIGPITAVTMRAEIAQFERFDNGKQLSRFCGLSPRNASSGQRQADAGLIKAGNPQLRAVIIQAAQRLINHDRRWRQFARTLWRRGKPRNVVVAAVANRWMRWLYHQMQPDRIATVPAAV